MYIDSIELKEVRCDGVCITARSVLVTCPTATEYAPLQKHYGEQTLLPALHLLESL
jgi:hypothetical protein